MTRIVLKYIIYSYIESCLIWESFECTSTQVIIFSFIIEDKDRMTFLGSLLYFSVWYDQWAV